MPARGESRTRETNETPSSVLPNPPFFVYVKGVASPTEDPQDTTMEAGLAAGHDG